MTTNTAITAYNHNSITTANGTTAPATYSINARGTVVVTAAAVTEDGAQKTIRLYIAPIDRDYPAARAAADAAYTATMLGRWAERREADRATDEAAAIAAEAVEELPTPPRCIDTIEHAANAVIINGVTYPAIYVTMDDNTVMTVGWLKRNGAWQVARRVYVEERTAEYGSYGKAVAAAEMSNRAAVLNLMGMTDAEMIGAAAAAGVIIPAARAAAEAVEDVKPAAEDVAPAIAAEAVEDVKPAAPAVKTPVAKPWIGSTMEGKGWRIVCDEAAQRIRVIVDGKATEAQDIAIRAAGYYWSPTMQSYNRGLKCKAYRAAQELAKTLANIA